MNYLLAETAPVSKMVAWPFTKNQNTVKCSNDDGFSFFTTD